MNYGQGLAGYFRYVRVADMLLNDNTLRLHGMSWGVKTTCFKAPGVSLGGSGSGVSV